MQKNYEDAYHRVEACHWWFVGRRELVHELVVQSGLASDARILEVGCSGGLLIQRLRQGGFRQVEGVDISEDAIELCRKDSLPARVMDAQKLDCPADTYDLVTASDILEHLPDEAGALREWHRVLKPGGRLVVFVPAFMFLWTAHDVANKHQRRYCGRELNERLQAAGFAIERQSYWNALLFPLIAAIRLAKRLASGGRLPEDGGAGDLFIPPAPINGALLSLVRCENWMLRMGVRFPVGVSVMAVARKPARHDVAGRF